MIKAVWRERWEEVRTLREEVEAHEVDVPVVIERAERREGMAKELKAALGTGTNNSNASRSATSGSLKLEGIDATRSVLCVCVRARVLARV